jgi:3-hydroxy-D-aspartate aldolase
VAEKAGRTRDLLARNGIDCPTVAGVGTGHLRVRNGERCLYRIAMRLIHLHGCRLRPQPRPRRRPDQGLRAEPLRLGDGDEPLAEDRAIVDAGLKALAFDSGPPLVCDEPAATYERASDEHGRLGISGATNRLNIGDKVRLIPGHCDPTVNLYDWYVGVRADRVEQLWPITARGAVY